MAQNTRRNHMVPHLAFIIKNGEKQKTPALNNKERGKAKSTQKKQKHTYLITDGNTFLTTSFASIKATRSSIVDPTVSIGGGATADLAAFSAAVVGVSDLEDSRRDAPPCSPDEPRREAAGDAAAVVGDAVAAAAAARRFSAVVCLPGCLA